MLTRLTVRDFAIVDRIEVEFQAGMTVLTGETGAGKSILVDALGFVLGDRGNAQVVRPGAKRAEFSAEFDVAALPAVVDWLEEHSLDEDDGCLIRRVIGADGRSRAFINGNAVTMQQLKAVGERLVDIHGQHFHQSLTRGPVQRDLLDYFGGLLDERRAVESTYNGWRGLADELDALLNADADRASRLEFVGFQLEELRALAIEPDEVETLRAERLRLANSGRLGEAATTALSLLFDGDTGNANSLVADAARSIEGLVDVDKELASVAELVESANIQISEAADELRRYVDSIDLDPGRLDDVESRLESITAVARKHRVEPETLHGVLERLETEYDSLSNAEAHGRELEQRVAEARDSYLSAADKLSAGRSRAAKKLAAAVTDAMQGLGMPGGQFDIELERLAVDDARAYGLDALRFLISANPGQPTMPLAKVASGGELSRMSLAIQVIASGGSAIPTMVFDEVDSGVGGGVAEMVGRRLAELGSERQVLCVTHLPQVASQASAHFRIAKVSDGSATRTTATALGRDERVQELARMLGGVDITQKTLEHAAEMLDDAHRKRA